MSNSEVALAAFKSWFSSVGGYIHPCVELVYDPIVGVHLRVKEDHTGSFSKDTLVISCPHSASLSALNARQINGKTFPVPHAEPDVEGNALVKGTKRSANGQEKSLKDSPNSGKPEVQVPKILRDNARPQFVAAVWVAVQYLLDDQSPWKAYIDILPGLPNVDSAHKETRSRGLAEIDTPLWWNEEECSWLQGTNLAKGIVDLEGVWEAEWRQWEDALVPWARQYGLELTWTLVKYGLTILGSRAFSSSQVGAYMAQVEETIDSILELYDPDMLLYPGVDSLNHNPLTKNRWHSDDKCFGIVVEDDLIAGMEVFNPYGGKGNGELLLSYGFCLPSNACDTYAIRLPPNTSQLFNIVQDAGHRRMALAGKARGLEPPKWNDKTAAGVSPMTPHNQPPAYNHFFNTYYVRPRSRHSLEEEDYPSLKPGELRTRDPADGLLGFPVRLLSILAATIATPFEASTVAADPSAYDTNELWHQLGPRMRIALCNLLLQRLTHELARLPAPSSDVQSQRQEWTNIYLTGQRQILTDNIDALEKGLSSYTNKRTMLTIYNALDLLGEGEKATFIKDVAAVYGIELPGDADPARTLTAQARALGIEEDIWALWIGVYMRQDVVGIDPNKRKRDKKKNPGSAVVESLSAWRAFVTSAYGLRANTEANLTAIGEIVDADEDEDNPTTHLLTVLSALQARPSSLWLQHLWPRQYIAACAAVVQAETFDIKYSASSFLGMALWAMEQEADDDGKFAERRKALKANEGEESEVVTLYIGPAIDVDNRGKV